jgi:ABC-2 type transport system ATP-binding protein
VLSTESLAGSGRAVVRLRSPLDDDDLAARGLSAEPTPLQQLVVALSTHRSAPAPRNDHHSDDFLGATR